MRGTDGSPGVAQISSYSLTANRYDAGGSAGYKLDDKNYIVGSLRYDHDEFSTYDYQATASIGYGYQFIKNASTESFQMATPDGRTALSYAVRVPRGVIAVVCPWNLPLLLMTWKVGPALACGNTVVVKPSEETPATAALLGEVMNKVGIPKGVYNVVHGFGPGSAGVVRPGSSATGAGAGAVTGASPLVGTPEASPDTVAGSAIFVPAGCSDQNGMEIRSRWIPRESRAAATSMRE